MSTFELAGEAMLQVQDGNRSLADALVALFRRRAQRPVSERGFSGASFGDQEPALAAEAGALPEEMRII